MPAAEEEGKKKARLARFGSEAKAETKADTKVDTKTDTKTDTKADPVEEEKRKARALRFGSLSFKIIVFIYIF